MSFELGQNDNREFQLGQIDIKEINIDASNIIRLPLDRPTQDKTVIPTKEQQLIKADNGYELKIIIVEPIPDEYIIPEGTLEISDNGNYDVKNYENVAVNVSFEGENKLAGFLSNKNITINASDFGDATSIRNYLFYNSNIIAVEIPNTITSINYYSFYKCENLTSITIPSSVTSIGDYAFNSCKGLTSITIPDSVTQLGSRVFYSCQGLTSITIGNGLTSLGSYAFGYCTAVTDLTLGNNIKTINDYAFYNCEKLTSITIPSAVTIISTATFSGCIAIEKVNVLENSQLETISSNAFYNDTKISLYDFRNCTKVPSLANINALGHVTGCKIVIPDALYDEWTTANVWSTLTDVVWVKASEYVE